MDLHLLQIQGSPFSFLYHRWRVTRNFWLMVMVTNPLVILFWRGVASLFTPKKRKKKKSNLIHFKLKRVLKSKDLRIVASPINCFWGYHQSNAKAHGMVQIQKQKPTAALCFFFLNGIFCICFTKLIITRFWKIWKTCLLTYF